ncbi:alpha-glucosidase [Iodobacter fluviatilis]|uniref:Alpha-glucosidase n=1 Tax=Iodobacter fluviatilis TaxID=537 RepID=A0A7G3G556_9NEIS|nr:alpha-glucosidase [Iodobacter fluviatilis]QBC42262.1 alpha-glucosidase [Iodobacter fluviatilis]
MLKTDREWWRGAVIYQVYPRSFADANADGVGDLQGLLGKLPYIAALGVDAVWISPFFKSPMKDFGYDVSDYCQVDPLFGTLADFDAVLAKAHQLGLKVMIDQVLSHTSDQNTWFTDSRQSRTGDKADWYVWADAKADGSAPNNWLSVFGGPAWTWDTRRCQYYLHNFLSSQPDLNFHCPAVQDAILEAIRFWLARGVDGFRFDACNFHFHDRKLRNNPPAKSKDTKTVSPDNPYGFQAHVHDKSQPENIDFLKRVRLLLDEYGAMSVGEVGDDDSLKVMAEYTTGGDKLNMAYSFNLLTKDFTAAYIRKQIEDLEKRIGDGWGCWSIGNHDVMRVLSRWGNNSQNPRFSRSMLAMLLCFRGSACLWQGDELGLPEADIPFELLQDPYGIAMWPEFKGRDGCRTPMPWQHDAAAAGFSSGAPWLPVPESHQQLAVSTQEHDTKSTLNFYRHFISWRKTQAVLWQGDIQFMDAPEPLLAFSRSLNGERWLCVFNLSESCQLLPCKENLTLLVDACLSGASIKSGMIEFDHWGALIARVEA